MNKRITLAAIMAVLIITAGIGAFFVLQEPAFAEISEEHQVWFTPAPLSGDLLRLFTEPNQWERAKGEIDVYVFFSTQIVGGFSKKQVMNAGLESLEREKTSPLPFVFSKLKEWGKETAIEAASGVAVRFKGGREGEKRYREIGVADCKTREQAINDYAIHTKEAIKRALSLGGNVHYLVMDELLHYWYPYPVISDERPKPCAHNNMSEIVEDTVKYIKEVQAAYPSVLIGDMEPYPKQSVGNLKTWVIELEKRGIRLAFFNLDVEGWVYKKPAKQVKEELRELRSFFKSRNIPFGVIYTDNTWENIEGWKDGRIIYKKEYSDKDYYENTIEWIHIVKNAIGEPDHFLFNSWREAYADKWRAIPRNLPEDDPYSHTHLINEGLEIFRDKE